MRTISLFTVFICAVLITFPSCKKAEIEQASITQTVNASVKVDETYSLILPANESPFAYTIIKQSRHSSMSVIEKNAAGKFVYSFIPLANFNGTDAVVLSNEKSLTGGFDHPTCNHQNCKHHGKPHHGNCQHNGQSRIIVINFTVAGNNTVTSSSKSSTIVLSK